MCKLVAMQLHADGQQQQCDEIKPPNKKMHFAKKKQLETLNPKHHRDNQDALRTSVFLVSILAAPSRLELSSYPALLTHFAGRPCVGSWAHCAARPLVKLTRPIEPNWTSMKPIEANYSTQ